MVLAEKGTLDHAKDVFARVREVSAEVLGDVWINLAHVYLAQNKHNEVTHLLFRWTCTWNECHPAVITAVLCYVNSHFSLHQ